jgi:hypothetical protein
MGGRNSLCGGTEINDVKHQGFAVAVLPGQKPPELMYRSQFGVGESSRNRSRGKRGDLEFDLPGNPASVCCDPCCRVPLTIGMPAGV